MKATRGRGEGKEGREGWETSVKERTGGDGGKGEGEHVDYTDEEKKNEEEDVEENNS